MGQALGLKIHFPSRVGLCPPAFLPTIVVSWGKPFSGGVRFIFGL